MTLRPKVIWTIFKRNFTSYFSGVLGYLFIIAFVASGGALAFNTQFFAANEPNLDQLTEWYPLLLLFIIPAITMGVWADERRSGTDELLFTLPATDLEILLGKYFAVLATYTIALVFSMAHVFVLWSLGNPDMGLIVTTYFGYWIAGAALVSAGMLASILTRSMTVAFVLGVLICGIPVFLGYAASGLPESMSGTASILENFSMREQFRDFGMGIVPLSGLVYFLGFTVFMLYLNLVMMTYRHWSSGKQHAMEAQFGVRTVCLAIIIVCFTAWVGYAAWRVDATSERLFSLSRTTRNILKQIEPERPIEVQAFLSPDVPREYVDTRKQLVGLLRQFDELAGKNLEVRLVNVEPFSEQAEEAEKFGIEPVQVLSEREGRRTEEEVYLGAVVISSYDKVVVPFFGKGLPIEYELTRSIQTVANKERHTVAVLETDANLLQGSQEWQIVTELRKQYNVESVSPASEIDAEEFDVLIAAMPSSLTDNEMDNLVKYVKAGNPTLIFDDPYPLTFSSQFGVSNAPRQPKPRPGGHMGMGMMGGQQQPPPKADGGRATRLLGALGIDWEYDRVTFDTTNPHPEFEMLPKEYIFITRDGGNEKAFSSRSDITKGLQEMIALYAGTIEQADEDDEDIEYTPLLQTGESSGLLEWEEFVDDRGFNMFAMAPAARPKPNPFRVIDDRVHTVAAQVLNEDEANPLNAIYVADVDMISDFFFQERSMGNLDLEFDNVTFVLNAVDKLAGDESYIELRSRRPKHRTLTTVEAKKRNFTADANDQEKKADEAAEEELEKRKKQLKERVDDIRNNENLDARTRAQLIEEAQEAEQKGLSLAEARIEQEKEREIMKIKARTNRQIREVENWYGFQAIWLPPLPAIILGFVIFVMTTLSERRTIVESRRRTH